MVEREASRTAVLVCQARAVADGRTAIGRFADPIARELLTRDAVASTIAAIGARSAPASRLAINYQSPSLIASLGRAAMRWSARLTRRPDPLADEPQRSTWTPGSIADLLEVNGFEVVSDDDLLALAQDLGLEPKARSSLRNGRVVVADRNGAGRPPHP